MLIIKTKWLFLLLVFGLVFFGLGCMSDLVTVEGFGANVFFPGLTGWFERIWPEEEGVSIGKGDCAGSF